MPACHSKQQYNSLNINNHHLPHSLTHPVSVPAIVGPPTHTPPPPRQKASGPLLHINNHPPPPLHPHSLTHPVSVPAVVEQHRIAWVWCPPLSGHVPQEHLGANSSDDRMRLVFLGGGG